MIPTEVAKKAQRTAILKLLKTGLTADQRRAQSQLLCHRVAERVNALASASLPPTGRVHVCSFLPMYFEPDLTGVMSDLWSGVRSSQFQMYVPRMVPADGIYRNEMHFVEVLSQADLLESFAPQGKWNITEVTPEVWKRDCLDSQRRGVLGHIPPAPSTFFTSDKGQQHLLLVLCPATAFDSSCGRIGKGAGFYDRFISEAMRQLNVSSPPTITMKLIGVGFDEQVVTNVPMEPSDVFMDEVLTPTHHFIKEVALSQ